MRNRLKPAQFVLLLAGINRSRGQSIDSYAPKNSLGSLNEAWRRHFDCQLGHRETMHTKYGTGLRADMTQQFIRSSARRRQE